MNLESIPKIQFKSPNWELTSIRSDKTPTENLLSQARDTTLLG